MDLTFAEIINAEQAVVMPRDIVAVAKDIVLHITENICLEVFRDNIQNLLAFAARGVFAIFLWYLVIF